MSPNPAYPWPEKYRRRFFYVLFGAALVGGFFLLYPFLFTLMFAAATAVVAQPLRQRFERALGTTNRSVAALLTLGTICCLVLLPAMALIALLMHDITEFVDAIIAWVSTLNLPPEIEKMVDGLGSSDPVGEMTTILSDDPNQFAGLAPIVSGFFAWLGNAGLDIAVYFLVTFSLLAEGERVMRLTLQLFPLDPHHAGRLFEVFRDIARNFLVGTVATAALQGAVAGIGWWLMGLPNTPLFAVAIAVSSLVPVVGTLVAWGPAALAAGYLAGPGTAVFVVVWNIVFTGTIDNIAKPLFLRGGSELHPVIIYLAVFGGLIWFGLPGLLFGPLVAAVFTALFQIHRETFLGIREPIPANCSPPTLPPSWYGERVEAS